MECAKAPTQSGESREYGYGAVDYLHFNWLKGQVVMEMIDGPRHGTEQMLGIRELLLSCS